MTMHACSTCGEPFERAGSEGYCSSDCRHGTVAGYRAGCTDTCCRGAWADNHRDARTRRYLTGRPLIVDALATHRRIQALAWTGHSTYELDRCIDRSPGYTAHVLQQPRIRATTATLYAAAYDEHADHEATVHGVTNRAAAGARGNARRRGWHPPEAWDDIDDPGAGPAALAALDQGDDDVDWVVVERIFAGDPVPATTTERVAVVARWRHAGRSLNELERLTGWRPSRYYTPRRDEVA